jgi:hypothetical protein
MIILVTYLILVIILFTVQACVASAFLPAIS